MSGRGRPPWRPAASPRTEIPPMSQLAERITQFRKMATDDPDNELAHLRLGQRPGCMEGKRAKQLPAPPIPDEIGERIYRDICGACWTLWFRDLSIKVINELRLDLSSEFGQTEYDRHMREFFGFEEEAKV